MNRPHHRRVSSRRRGAPAALALLGLAALLASPAAAGPTIGFVEDFAGAGNLSGWTSSAENSNPGTGGVGGAGDGYLRTARSAFAGQLGAHSTFSEYIGDWIAAGADRIRLSLNDVGADQALEVHVSIGNPSNFWQYNVGFIPPNGAWAEFTVDLTDSTAFTQIIDFAGGATWSEALRAVDRVLVRHDLPPFTQTPNTILGEFGIDGIKIEASLIDVDALPVAGGRPVQLAPPSPNPSRGSARFAFESFDDEAVRVAIVDVRGRVLYSELLPAAPAGPRSWTWDGRDAQGRVVPAGVYRVRAYSPAGGTSRAFVRIN